MNKRFDSSKKIKDDLEKKLKELRDKPENRNCFDCNQKGITYVNCTIGSFVCTSCSGILRGITPPHRVKSISMATFSAEEIEFLRNHGNDECAKTWLGLWDSKRVVKQDHREFMVDKYERKRYYLEKASPLKSITQSTSSNVLNHNHVGQNTASLIQENNLVALKSISLTPPSMNKQNRTHSNNNSSIIVGIRRPNNMDLNQTGIAQNFQQNINKINSNNIRQVNKMTESNTKPCNNNNCTSSNNNTDSTFVADFGSASIYSSTNTNSIGTNYQNTNIANKDNNDKINNNTIDSGNGSNENFADFENNQIYNAAEELYNKLKNNNITINNNNNNSANIQWSQWSSYPLEQNRWSLPKAFGSLNNSLTSSGGTINSSSSLNSTPSADRYAALKDLDEQFREIKSVEKSVNDNEITAGSNKNIANPFKTVNPFQPTVPSQNYQNWNIPDQNLSSQLVSGHVLSPSSNVNSFNNGFIYNNMSSMLNQKSLIGQNPFMAGGSSSNNPFL